jgi:hypothetical protein
MSALGRVPRTRQLSMEVRCCTRDAGQPLRFTLNNSRLKLQSWDYSDGEI